VTSIHDLRPMQAPEIVTCDEAGIWQGADATDRRVGLRLAVSAPMLRSYSIGVGLANYVRSPLLLHLVRDCYCQLRASRLTA
jgi:hypothetical protein